MRYDRIDVLVNNAGLIWPRLAQSTDGHELIVAVNHLAPFLLTNLLLDRLKQSAPARIVNVASTAHKGARLDPATMTKPADWTPLSAYGRSKLANVLFTRALARRLDPASVTVCCLHPGTIATDIGNRAGTLAGVGWRLAKLFLPGPETGARTRCFSQRSPIRLRFTAPMSSARRSRKPIRRRRTSNSVRRSGRKAPCSSGCREGHSGQKNRLAVEAIKGGHPWFGLESYGCHGQPQPVRGHRPRGACRAYRG